MANISLPSNIRFEQGERPNEGVLIVEPCHPGYGTTLGNALRRVMLSSLEGAAVTAVKIKGVSHEFQAIEGIKEDALEIIMNLKSLRLKSHSEEPQKLTLKVTGQKSVTGADIEPNAEVEVINTDQPIATVTSDSTTLEMELIVSKGRGYVPTEEREDESHDIDTIAIDALYSPVRNVGYKVENTRVGDITNYDKLLLNIETDGTISPEDAVHASAKILIDHFGLLTGDMNGSAAEEPNDAEEVAVEETE